MIQEATSPKANSEEKNFIQIGGKKFDKYLLAVLIIAILAFVAQAYFVSQIKFVGEVDIAHYGEAAANLVQGKGFSLNYINEYFIKFKSIMHPEEYGFPGVSLLIAPFILLFGKTAFTIKLPGMIAGVILIPILTYYFGKELFNQRTGFLAAISMIMYPVIFTLAFGTGRDPIYAFFLLIGSFFFFKGMKNDNQKNFLLMGLFLGFSYLVRQTTLVVLPVLFAIYYLTNKNISKKFLYGLCTCFLVMAPWLFRNYMIFGDPFFTVNKYSSWIMGYFTYFEGEFFNVYWNYPPPSLHSLLNIAGNFFYFAYARRFFTSLGGMLTNFVAINILAFIGLALASVRNISKKLSVWMIFLAVFSIFAFLFAKPPVTTSDLHFIAFAALRAVPYAGILLTSLFLYTKDSNKNTFSIIFIGAYAFFFSTIWIFDVRYWLPVVPFLFIYSWFALENIVQKIGDRISKPQLTSQKIWHVLLIFLIIFAIVSLPQTFGKFIDKNSAFPYHDDAKANDIFYLSNKINNITEKDAVIMGCDVGVLHFYTGRRYLELPATGFINIASIMKEYNASYFTLLGCERRAADVKLYAQLFGNKISRNAVNAQDPNATIVRDYDEKSVYRITLPPEYKSNIYKIKFVDTSANNQTGQTYGLTISIY